MKQGRNIGQISVPAKHKCDVIIENAEKKMVSLTSRGRFLEKTTGESLDLSSVLGTACTNGRSAFMAAAYLHSNLAPFCFRCTSSEYKKLGRNGTQTWRGKKAAKVANESASIIMRNCY